MQSKVAIKKDRKEVAAEIENVSEGPTKAKWNDVNTEIFLKVCVEEIEAGNRPHTHFTKEGWAKIVEKFHEQTGNSYDKKQLKNRWDALKQEFGMWAKLVEKVTGLGWDPVKQTIKARPEWWAEKAKSEQAASDLQFGATSGDCNYWYVGETSRDNGECTVDDKMSSLIGLQTRSKFYKVEVGLMALLRNCLESEAENSKTILSGYVDHFQSIESEDAGWGCGWRNIQMLCSHLLVQRPEAREVLFGGSEFVPDILSLQRWLEIAWERGFDEPGSAQFDHVIYGSKKWIGTTECAALLRSFGLRARVVDFGPKESESCYISVPGSSVDDSMDKASSDKMVKRKPKKCEAYQVFMDFVWNYFSDKSSIQFGHHQRVVISEKTPLYFQHDGHSRTIVGIQVKHQQNRIQPYNLLILDPAHSTFALERSLREKVGWQKLIKRGMHTLKKPQYQLCYVDPGIAGGEEMEKLKTIDSVFLEF